MPTDPAIVTGVLDTLASNEHKTQSLDALNGISMELAKEPQFREQFGRSPTRIWSQLFSLWESLSKRDQDVLYGDKQRDLTLALARFTRNIVAGCPNNQMSAFQCEPAIRKQVYLLTSYAFVMDATTHKLVRLLGQTISNMVTANEELLSALWREYMMVPEEQSILLRLLSHPDDGVAVAAIVLAFNCIANSKERMQTLIGSRTGKRFCVLLLDKLACEAQARDETEVSELFDMGWRIFEAMLDNNLVHALMALTHIDQESTSPHRTTFLKILDSYLLRTLTTDFSSRKAEIGDHNVDRVISGIADELLSPVNELVNYANTSLKHSIGSSRSSEGGVSNDNRRTDEASPVDRPPLQNYDSLLPKVCEAIVLVVQCFCTLSLTEGDEGSLLLQARRTKKLLTDASLADGVGLVEGLIELLRLLDEFVPRIAFGKTSWSTPRPDAPVPVLSGTEERGFFYVKRDVVRLIGILCYENRVVQDRVRLCRGIPAVMNLCVVDERNPYLREHALFALRNLLTGNAENQAVVAAIKPMGAWDDDGVLRDLPGVRK